MEALEVLAYHCLAKLHSSAVRLAEVVAFVGIGVALILGIEHIERYADTVELGLLLDPQGVAPDAVKGGNKQPYQQDNDTHYRKQLNNGKSALFILSVVDLHFNAP